MIKPRVIPGCTAHQHLLLAGPGAGLGITAALAAACLVGCAAPPTSVVPEAPAQAALPAPAPAPYPVAARPAPPAPARPPGPLEDADSWNRGQIAWRTFEDGRAEAARTRKPMMLVFYTTWCPHCRNFSHVFDDATVVAAARDFVMVRANADEQRELSQRFAPDGTYIPRTYFLSSAGELAADVKAHDAPFAYFYDERDPSALVAGMQRARAAL